tara:strand:+ start:689 stop:1171 length:483 start_codon:yes stop_codon:yes gene_type:complete
MEFSFSIEDAIKARNSARMKKKTFVLTNGCFDLFHAGHAYGLNKASEYGDLLWVGINSDKSVKELKGEHRPINSQNNRGYLLNSLKVVDGVFLFDKQNLADEILLLKPDIYVKSTDYNYDSMNKEERNALEKVGSKIFFVPLLEKHSTSLIINKIKGMNI